MLYCTPFLLFDGNFTEAMTFYHECFGGEVTVTKLGDSPMKGMLPPEKHARIINAHLKSDNIEISATDWMASPEFEPIQGNTFAIFVIGRKYDELKTVFDKLRDGTITKGYRNYTNCHLEFTNSFTINMVFSGFLKEIRRNNCRKT